jgi:hypothetical protein
MPIRRSATVWPMTNEPSGSTTITASGSAAILGLARPYLTRCIECVYNTPMKRSQSAGRPVAGSEKKQRYQVVLEPSIAENARRDGGDNLSRGLSKLPQINARLRSVKDKYESALKAIAETTTDQKARKAALDALGEGYKILSEFFQAI